MPDADAVSRRQLLAATAGAFVLAPLAAACGQERSDPGQPAAPAQPAPSPEQEPPPAAEQAPAPTPEQEPPAPAEAAEPPPQPGSPAASDPAAAGDAPLVTEVPAMQALVQSLQYVNQSPREDQRCDNCVLFVAEAFAGDKGKCQLFAQGAVLAQGWCASWQPRPPGA